MPPVAVTLGHMVDLALGSPEVGAVNFNVLHGLLHAVLQQLNMTDVKADLPEGEDADSSKDHTRHHKPTDLESDSGIASASEAGVDQSDRSRTRPVTRTPYHALEDKVHRLERQMAALGALPSTKELMDQTAGDSSGEETENKVPRPVAEMWQSMQLSRKVDANTQGVSKVEYI